MRAIDKGLVTISIHDLREYGIGNYRQVDDYQFGGGAGMVMMAEPLNTLLEKLTSDQPADAIIYLTPDGESWKQSTANAMSLNKRLILICGHYKGIDQRIRDLWSLTRCLSETMCFRAENSQQPYSQTALYGCFLEY